VKHPAALAGILLSILLLSPCRSAAQTPLDRLREEVRALTAVHCSAETPGVVRDANGRLLERRREAVALLLEQQLGELKEYPKRAGITLTAEDQNDLASAMTPIQVELDALHRPLTAICAESGGSQTGRMAHASGSATEVGAPDPPAATGAVLASFVRAPMGRPAADPLPPARTPADSPRVTPLKTDPAAPPGALPGTAPETSKGSPKPTTTLGSNRSDPAAGGGGEGAAATDAAANAATPAAAAPKALTWNSMFTRAVAGVDVSGASSLPTQQKVFVEFNLTAPLGIMFKGTRDKVAERQECLNVLNAAMAERYGAESKVTALKQSTADSVKSSCTKPYAEKNRLDASNLTAAQLGNVEVAREIAKPLLQDRIDAAESDLYKAQDPTNHRLWVWMNPRISSLPQQATDLLSSVSSSTPSFNSLAKSSFNQVVQGFELLGGLEYLWNHPGNAWRFGNAGLALAFVGGAGFSTPFPANLANTQQYNVPATLTPAQITTIFGPAGVSPVPCATGVMPTTMAKCTNVVAFVPPDRTRFYAQYYGGLRLKTFFFHGDDSNSEFGDLCSQRKRDELCPVFPGIFELGVGQNAAVSGGRLRGMVLRTEAFYPLPFAGSFHLFFTSWVHLGGHNFTSTPVILDNTSPPLTSLNVLGVVILPHEVPNRDYYRLGMGVDIISLINKISKASADKAAHNTQDAQTQQAVTDQKKSIKDLCATQAAEGVAAPPNNPCPPPTQ
jgi:hypothetical protein